MRRKIQRTFLFMIALFGTQRLLMAQNPPELKLNTGKEIYEAACIGCHGPGGKGQPETTLGFEKSGQFPDFSDCSGSSRESTFDWRATIHEGGPGRGWVPIMPSFAEALTSEQIDKVLQYLRSLCTEPGWPLGELNFPRAIFTEKAFPEDEWVLTSAANVNNDGLVRRRAYLRTTLWRPQLTRVRRALRFLQRDNKSWIGGIGDLVFGYKRVMFSNKERFLVWPAKWRRRLGTVCGILAPVSPLSEPSLRLASNSPSSASSKFRPAPICP